MAKKFIVINCRDWCKFKIGITENPHRRWHDPHFGYKRSRNKLWDCFAVIYTSPTSKRTINKYDKPKVKELKQTSTGMMETLLIHIFEELPTCINRKGAGADCPSEGSPHFCYVVASYAVWRRLHPSKCLQPELLWGDRITGMCLSPQILLCNCVCFLKTLNEGEQLQLFSLVQYICYFAWGCMVANSSIYVRVGVCGMAHESSHTKSITR